MYKIATNIRFQGECFYALAVADDICCCYLLIWLALKWNINTITKFIALNGHGKAERGVINWFELMEKTNHVKSVLEH